MKYTFSKETANLFDALQETTDSEYHVSSMTEKDVTVFLAILQARELSDMDYIMNNPCLVERIISLALLGNSADNIFRLLARQGELDSIQIKYNNLKQANMFKRLL